MVDHPNWWIRQIEVSVILPQRRLRRTDKFLHLPLRESPNDLRVFNVKLESLDKPAP